MKKNAKSHRTLLIIWSILLLLIFSAFFNNYLVVKASIDAPTNDQEDYEKALKTAPKGLHLYDKNNSDKSAFVIADFSKANHNRLTNSTPSVRMDHGSSLINNAKIVPSTNPNSPQTSIIQMTNDHKQTGAVWSNRNTQNYFDISHEQIASMWIYFGHTNVQLTDPATFPGDGMAFVIQNDPNSENAIALSATGVPVNGQSLGVWGADWDITNSDPNIIAKTAIQNSWALEFDTFVNWETDNITGEGNSFDSSLNLSVQNNQRHIAANYPALSSTYIPDVNNNGRRFFRMNHQKAQYYSDLVDSQWRHITIKWEPKNSTMTYTYNDKDPVTGLARPVTKFGPSSPNSAGSSMNDTTRISFQIDTSNFYKTPGSLNSDDTKLYWGFTGSTGKNTENNLMIFESIPSYVDASATSSIYNDSNDGQPVKEGSTVEANDNIRYNYDLKYIGWDKTWADINADMGVPDNMHFTSGTIRYPNSKTDSSTQPIPQDVFTEYDKDPSSKKLSYKLNQILDHTNNEAHIELHGEAINKTSSTVTVPAVYSSFDGDNLITGTQSNSFKIKNRLFQLESDSANPIIAKSHEDVVIPGHVSYSNNSIVPDYNSMVVHQKLNGIDSIADTTFDSSGNFTLKLKADSLKDLNQLSFYVTDRDGNQTNTIDRQIVVKGLLQFGFVQQDVFFRPINSTSVSSSSKPFSQPQIIRRAGDWAVNIVDNRDKGKNWIVRAKADPLKSNIDGSHFDGKIIFKDKNGNISDLSNTTDIASGSKTTEGTQISNITQPWTSDTGILLAMTGNNPEGKYTSQITWTIPDSIANS